MKYSLKRNIFYAVYRYFALWLPANDSRITLAAKAIRGFLTSRFVNSAGRQINIQRGAKFGPDLSIGDRSGIGINSQIQNGVSIGRNVMIGPECFIYTMNHRFDRTDIPMIDQGISEIQPVVIEDDVWIGARVTILPGVTIGEGAIIGAGAVVPKNIPRYAIAAGNPAEVKAYRIQPEEKTEE